MTLARQNIFVVMIILSPLIFSACSDSQNDEQVRILPQDIQDMSIVQKATAPETKVQETRKVLNSLLKSAKNKDYQSSKKHFSQRLLKKMQGEHGKQSDADMNSDYINDMDFVAHLNSDDFTMNEYDGKIEYHWIKPIDSKQYLAVFQFVKEKTAWKLDNYFISEGPGGDW